MTTIDYRREGLARTNKKEARFCFRTFHQATIACFSPSHPPDREPDFVSPGLSVYWDVRHGVIRASDHWSEQGTCREIASCYWTYDGYCCPGEWEVGYASYLDFQPRSKPRDLQAITEYDFIVAKTLLVHGGGLSVRDWASAGLGPIPAWCYKAPVGTLAADPAALYLASHPEAEHVVTSSISARTRILNSLTFVGADLKI